MLATLRILVPGFWLGLIVALAFIETPLKFLAPGITTPLALGIGRLVLSAAEIASVVLLIALTVISVLRPRLGRAALAVVGGLWVVLLVQIALIRPPLNARTDLVIAGDDPGVGSPLHVLYIVTDLVLVALLLAFLVLAHRSARAGSRD